MKTIAQFIDLNGISNHMERLRHELDWLLEARDAEHRAELLKLQDDLLQAANREVMAEALIERLRGELDEVKHDRDEWSVECTASRLREAILRGDAAPSPAESTPVQVPIYGDGKRMDGPAATLALKNPAAINRTTPGTTTCELCMQNDADRPAAFQCDGCAEYSCIEHAAAHRCLTTPAAPPDDIRAFTPPLTTREWMMDHERRLAALEAKGEPGTHAKGEER